ADADGGRRDAECAELRRERDAIPAVSESIPRGIARQRWPRRTVARPGPPRRFPVRQPSARGGDGERQRETGDDVDGVMPAQEHRRDGAVQRGEGREGPRDGEGRLVTMTEREEG